MKKIFYDEIIDIKEQFIFIEDDDFYHLAKVLRVKRGENFVIGDKNNDEYKGKIVDIDKKRIKIKIEDKLSRNVKSLNLTIIFSILKGDKNDFLIQKCTELGVDSFIPVISENTIINIKDNKEKRIKRWKKIIREASMQSCREKKPEISDIMVFNDLLIYDIKGDKYFCYVNEKKSSIYKNIEKITNNNKLSFFIGPEGGFSKKEAENLLGHAWKGLNLSPFTLKSETAAIYVVSLILSNFYK